LLLKEGIGYLFVLLSLQLGTDDSQDMLQEYLQEFFQKNLENFEKTFLN